MLEETKQAFQEAFLCLVIERARSSDDTLEHFIRTGSLDLVWLEEQPIFEAMTVLLGGADSEEFQQFHKALYELTEKVFTILFLYDFHS